MLQIRDICKKYVTGDLTQTALDHVSFNLRSSEFVAVLGPSGSGKTTLLNVIGGLDRYDAGDLIINGVSTRRYTDRDWDSYRNHTVGFVFQSYNLIPHQSVLANVELALTISGMPRGARRQKAREALEKVGLGDQLHKRPNQMSGGQMQRVAIARALVNDPDILLADEPTGALDSETSIQVMELLKEVARDRLVVLVTHNNELADRYATRILRLQDGKITGDSNPYSVDEASQAQPEHRNMGHASMSFATALSLSFNNLRTKRGRTLLTAFAGSIGIIGIALILALSTGVNRYVQDIQRDTMSSYPIDIEARSFDLTSILEAGRRASDRELTHALDGVYADTSDLERVSGVSASIRENDLTAFKKYLDDPACPLRAYLGENGVVYGYGVKYGVYARDPDGALVSADGVTPGSGKSTDGSFSASAMMSGMSAMSSGSYASGAPSIFEELLPGGDGGGLSAAVTDNYEAVCGRWPQAWNEVVLVLDKNSEVPLTSLYELGLLPSSGYTAMIDALDAGESVDTDVGALRYEDVCGKTLYLLPACSLYADNGDGTFSYEGGDASALEALTGSAETLTIVGVVRPAEGASGLTLTGSVGYLASLTDHVADETDRSAVVLAQKASPDVSVLSGLAFAPADDAAKAADAVKYLSGLNVSGKAALYRQLLTASGAAVPTVGEETLAAALDAALARGMETDTLVQIYDAYVSPGTYDGNLSDFGVVSADAPASIRLYADTFEDKDAISDCIRDYNASAAEADQITYTDYVGLLMSSVTTIVNVISYVLIAFVAVSLVVSSIMIGIITYISVLERTKEIGILRAIGASKRNIARVFNAETLIVGLCAGLIGVGLTELLLIPGNLLLHSLLASSTVNAASINAVLPPADAALLVALSTVLTLIAGLIPSGKAARKDPVVALRTE